jgi:hypothetical protein
MRIKEIRHQAGIVLDLREIDYQLGQEKEYFVFSNNDAEAQPAKFELL